MGSVTCVLLGVAEVKLPLRRLPQEVRTEIAYVSHWAVLHSGHTNEEDKQELLIRRQKFIGEVDNFYALREVVVKVIGEQCQILQGSEVVLKHRTSDVIIATPVEGSPLRVVYISRSDSFGRAAVVLQMKTGSEVEQILALFSTAVPSKLSPLTQQNSDGLQIPPSKEPKASWGRGMGKKFTAMLASLAGTTNLNVAIATTAAATSITAAAAATANTNPCSEDMSVSGANLSETLQPSVESMLDSDDEEDSSDDTDSKSAQTYYEDMGFDANVQERLYDDPPADTVSRSSDSSLESNASIIEAELRFFIETDEDFVKSIQSLEDDRERLADAETPQFIRENLILLFVQVKALIQLHTELHAEFEKSNSNLQMLSEAIVHHQREYENYVYFMENIPTVDRILNNHKDYFLTHMPELPEKLRKPRMRLHYYVLTLETLHKKCCINEEKTALQKAIDVLKVPLKKADSKLFLGAVTGSPFDLTNFGNLIRHSDLGLRRGGDLPRRVYHVLMLKTLILLTISEGRYYRYITSFRMDQVGLGKQERGILFNLDVRNGPRGQVVHYTFKAKNINMQQQWINDLKGILKNKPQSSSQRNSYSECESDSRQSGMRSKVRRGPSMEKSNWGVSQASHSDSDVLDDDSSRTGKSETNVSWTGRRAAIKKNSSSSGKARPVVRQPSGYSSDGESTSARWSSHLPPLTVWTAFQQLEDLYKGKSLPNGTKENHHVVLITLLEEEEKYISGVNEQLGYFLQDEYLRPPQFLMTHLRHIYDFHSNIFRPLLEKAVSSGTTEEVAQCFIDCSEKLKELYSNYLADRSRLEVAMEDMNCRYVHPVRQFELYMMYLSRLNISGEPEHPAVTAALAVLRECVGIANTILLTETIEGAPFDLDECGPVLLEGNAKVRWTGHMNKQEFHVVLLSTMILLLEPHPPTYHYVEAIRMDTVGLGPAADDYSFQLEVRTVATKTLTYHFRTRTKNIKKKWMREIMDILKMQVEKLKEKQLRRLGTETGKMKTLETGGDTELYKVSPRNKILIETDL
ncbi:uncharacterized protein [Cherax quadricarinatus]|nr:uncharacterized protein LOC128685100 [Cherax quadricarinatus]